MKTIKSPIDITKVNMLYVIKVSKVTSVSTEFDTFFLELFRKVYSASEVKKGST